VICKSILDLAIVVLNFKSLDSAVVISTGYGLDDRGLGVRVPVKKITLSLCLTN
jgi:hypothetical protein